MTDWLQELSDLNARIQGAAELPAELLKKLGSLGIGASLDDWVTYDAMCRIANNALELTLELLPRDVAHEVHALIQKQDYWRAAATVIGVNNQGDQPPQYVRDYMGVLLASTLFTSEAACQRPLRTAEVLAYWSAINAVHHHEKGLTDNLQRTSHLLT